MVLLLSAMERSLDADICECLLRDLKVGRYQDSGGI